jgi:HlyD family secretion protein
MTELNPGRIRVAILGLALLGAVSDVQMAVAQGIDAKAATTTTSNAPSITVVNAKRGTITESVTIGGTLVAREEVQVAAQVEGLAIVEILAEEGQTVAKGDVLARLSRETVDSALAQNTAQIARAEAAIAQARNSILEAEAGQVAAANSFIRTKKLQDQGVASAELFDQRQASARQSAARVTIAKEQLRLAEADLLLAKAQRQDLVIRLERTEIKATTRGLISRRAARLGAIAAGASDPLFRIVEDGDIELDADVAETTLARISVGQPATVKPAGFSDSLPAKVRLVSAEVSRTSRLGRVRIALANSSGLTVGAFGRGQIEIARSQGILLPLSAVQFTADGARIQVVKDGAVETRQIKTGLRQNGVIEITQGLAERESVVTVAGTFLRHGDRVNPVVSSN